MSSTNSQGAEANFVNTVIHWAWSVFCGDLLSLNKTAGILHSSSRSVAGVYFYHYQNRGQVVVKVNGSELPNCCVSSGVPQESVLIWIFINDLTTVQIISEC